MIINLTKINKEERIEEERQMMEFRIQMNLTIDALKKKHRDKEAYHQNELEKMKEVINYQQKLHN